MKIETHLFEVFDRDDFIYRKNAKNSEVIKHEYTLAWNKWKDIVEVSVQESECMNLKVESTEMWQNSGNLSKRFWSRIKDKKLLNGPSCIAAMISKDNLRIYLEWHGYQNQNLHKERKHHNNWVLFIDEWISLCDINISEYSIWTNLEEVIDFKEYTSLKKFLENENIKNALLDALKKSDKNWIRVGKIFEKHDVLRTENVTKKMGDMIKELEWIYHRATGLTNFKFDSSIKILDSNIDEKKIKNDKANSVKFHSNQQLIYHIHTYINNKGFYYLEESIQNLYLCLKTKPFVILSGISGTGKTQIVKLFAESIGATEENGQFKLIPVRPDWSDGSDLIGYEDIKGEFKPGPLTLVLQEANRPENQQKPYFILLDEMNLARVEYYFSDLLSVMESREKRNGEYISTPVVDRNEVGKLMLLNNVYFIGTVNMDETTHPFSPKVLDRANTIEYNDVTLNHFDFLIEQEEVSPVAISNEQLAGEFIKLKDAFSAHEGLVREITDWLVEINTILEKTKSHFGYRVRDEICFYMIYNEIDKLMPQDKAFDYQMYQKILPRLTGNDVKTEHVLKDLYKFCTNHVWEEGLLINKGDARFPKSAEKLDHMITKIQYDGFTSFWI